ncbi:MAG: hypothetical protein IKR18_09185 [Bacteroidaceae bacterium]|nr:hypothetical protein [Bacteroidaceae bacterium]
MLVIVVLLVLGLVLVDVALRALVRVLEVVAQLVQVVAVLRVLLVVRVQLRGNVELVRNPACRLVAMAVKTPVLENVIPLVIIVVGECVNRIVLMWDMALIVALFVPEHVVEHVEHLAH